MKRTLRFVIPAQAGIHREAISEPCEDAITRPDGVQPSAMPKLALGAYNLAERKEGRSWAALHTEANVAKIDPP